MIHYIKSWKVWYVECPVCETLVELGEAAPPSDHSMYCPNDECMAILRIDSPEGPRAHM